MGRKKIKELPQFGELLFSGISLFKKKKSEQELHDIKPLKSTIYNKEPFFFFFF